MMEEENRLQLAVFGGPKNSYQGLLDTQTELFSRQIEQLESIVSIQCSLTGVNPLSQEMAAGALSIKIGKRPRDLLNPKAVTYMQSVFAVKDAITKREIREISALHSVTATQVREFFNVQRTRVRKQVRLSREKALESSSSEQMEEGGVLMSSDPSIPIYPVPLNCMEPVRVEEGSCSSSPVETLPGLDESEKHFQENVFSAMRKEETFSGQVKLMEWILKIQNSQLLHWFLSSGGVMILATWCSQAASEEQTSVLHIILKVLCHLPLHKALPVHMSAVLQSVNKLRVYKTSDISNRARNLLPRWSKMFARAQALKKPSAVKSSSDAESEMLLKQSISEIMGDETWDSKFDLPGDSLVSSFESPEQFRRLEGTQPLKLLPASTDDSNKKLILGVSPCQTKGRRKVLMVEQPGQRPAGRSSQVSRSVTINQSRPLSADDIQKAKMRAQFMQSKHGKIQPSQARKMVSPSKSLVRPEVGTSNSTVKPLVRPEIGMVASHSKALGLPEVGKDKDPLVSRPPEVSSQQEGFVSNKMNTDVDEPLWKKCKKVQIPWKIPTELRIPDDWSIGSGENSKEVGFQTNRTHRERETVYKTTHEIPNDPNEPWDREMEYDDTLTPEIPIEQLPDNENGETEPSVSQNESPSNTIAPQKSDNGNFAEADPQLLAELLKHPELVFALQSGGLSSEEMVRLLDMIKAKGVEGLGTSLPNGLVGRKAEENVPVSLPSPTPSSDPVPNGWRPESSKFPFSRQDRESVSSAVQQQQLPARVQAHLQQQAVPQFSMPLSTGNAPQLHGRDNPHVLNKPPMHSQNLNYVNRAPVQIAMNGNLPPRPPPQYSYMANQNRNQIQNQNLVSNPHYIHPHQTNYNNAYVQQGPYGERNGFVGRSEFESWSPENSPMRHAGWGQPEPRMNANNNQNMGHYMYGPEFNQSGNPNSVGYRDFNGHGWDKRPRR